MKSVLILAIALLVAVPACKRSDSDRARASSEERTFDTQGLKQQRDDYVKAMEAKLDEFDKKVSGLEQRASAMKGAAKDDFEKSIDRLRDQRKAVARKLDDLKKVNVESWTTIVLVCHPCKSQFQPVWRNGRRASFKTWCPRGVRVQVSWPACAVVAEPDKCA